MDMDKIWEIISYALPSVITGGVAYYFFSKYVQLEESRRKFYIMKENTKTSLPLRLQAYERMVLFLERINPQLLLTRVTSTDEDPQLYARLLMKHIEMEFEHNLSQQIYLSDKAWSVIVAAKNTTVQMIRKTLETPDVKTATDFKKSLLEQGLKETFPSRSAIVFLKTEVMDLF